MAAQTTTVAELRPGGDVDGVFACSRKDRLTARSGSPYLALELRDRTGAVAARAFRNADFLAGRFDRGDIVRVRGRLLGHVALGHGMVMERARAAGVAREPLLAVCHCVLSHHGPDPRFRSPEALALYRLNAVDAAVKGALEHGLQ